MVGASLKSRSLVESCRFSVGTTPRTAGKTSKRKMERTMSEQDHSGTAESIAETGRADKAYFQPNWMLWIVD